MIKHYDLKTLGAVAAFGFVAATPAFAIESPGYFDGNGSDRYMTIPQSEDFNISAGGSFTVSCKITPNSIGQQRVLNNRYRKTAGNDVSGFDFYVMSSSVSNSVNYPNAEWKVFHHSKNTTLNTNEVYYLCWVYSGNSSVFYINDEAVNVTGGGVQSLDIPCYADILVGARYNIDSKPTLNELADYFDGKIDNIRFYGEALQYVDVMQDRNSETFLENKNIIAAYDFAKIDGDKVEDISGNGHEATLHNFPTYELPAEPDPTKLQTVSAENGAVEFFTLSGARVSESSLVRGNVYIRRQGTKVEKFFVK